MASTHQGAAPLPRYLFAFTVRDMAPHVDSSPRLSRTGQWLPPRPLHHNILVGSGVGADYHNHTSYGYNISSNALEDLQVSDPCDIYENMEVYRCVSMYYGNGTIWLVTYDATENQVGNGRSANDDDDDDSSSSDDNGAHEEAPYELYDWERLQFRHFANGASWVDYAVEQERLYASREDQRWQRRILPDAYLAPQGRMNVRGERSPYGSLCGNLAILLGLVAMAAAASGGAVHHSLLQVVRRTWNNPQHAHAQGWHDRRGLVITVYAEPPMAQAVHGYENQPLFR